MKLKIDLTDCQELTASVEVTTYDLASHFGGLAAILGKTINDTSPEEDKAQRDAINHALAKCLVACLQTLEAIPDDLIASTLPAIVNTVTQRLHTQTERWRTVAIHNLTATDQAITEGGAL
jgi:hypothetical protein